MASFLAGRQGNVRFQDKKQISPPHRKYRCDERKDDEMS